MIEEIINKAIEVNPRLENLKEKALKRGLRLDKFYLSGIYQTFSKDKVNEAHWCMNILCS